MINNSDIILLSLRKLHKQTNRLKSETKISDSTVTMTIINYMLKKSIFPLNHFSKEMMIYHQAVGQMAAYHFVKPKISLSGSH